MNIQTEYQAMGMYCAWDADADPEAGLQGFGGSREAAIADLNEQIAEAAEDAPIVAPGQAVRVALAGPVGLRTMVGAFGEVEKVVDGSPRWPVLVRFTSVPLGASHRIGDKVFFAFDELEAA